MFQMYACKLLVDWQVVLKSVCSNGTVLMSHHHQHNLRNNHYIQIGNYELVFCATSTALEIIITYKLVVMNWSPVRHFMCQAYLTFL